MLSTRNLASLIVVLAACRPGRPSDSEPPDGQPASTPRVPDQSPPGDDAPDVATAENIEDDEDADETCVADCMLEHQMQAMSPDVIEDNCRRSCIEPSRP